MAKGNTVNDSEYRKEIIKLLAAMWQTSEITANIALKIYRDLVHEKKDINDPNLYIQGSQILVSKNGLIKAQKVLVKSKLLIREIDADGNILFKFNPNGSGAAVDRLKEDINDVVSDIQHVLLNPEKWTEYNPNPETIKKRRLGAEKARKAINKNLN